MPSEGGLKRQFISGDTKQHLLCDSGAARASGKDWVHSVKSPGGKASVEEGPTRHQRDPALSNCL